MTSKGIVQSYMVHDHDSLCEHYSAGQRVRTDIARCVVTLRQHCSVRRSVQCRHLSVHVGRVHPTGTANECARLEPEIFTNAELGE